MIHLDLSDEEQQVLAEVLDSYLSELHTEISHTDTRDYREMLKGRKAVLTKLLDAVQPAGG